MADNLSVPVTAETSSLRAQLALAQADLRAFSAETRKLATDIRSGSDASGVLRGQLERVAGQFTAAKSNVAGLTAALREGKTAHEEHAHGIEAVNHQLAGMLSPLTAARSGLVEFAEIAGAAFAFEKISELIKEMTELGEKTEIMAAAVGVTPAQFSALSAAMQIAGADADGTSRVLERLGKSVGEAIRNPASNTADAFRRLGISEEELKAHSNDLLGMLHLLAERWGAYQDSLQKTEAMHEVAGRGMDKLIPIFHKGAEGFQEAEQRAHDVGATLSNMTIKALAESQEKMNTLGAAAKGLGANLVALLTPMINGVTNALTAMIAAFNRALSLKSFAAVQTEHISDLTGKLRETEKQITATEAGLKGLNQKRTAAIAAGFGPEAVAPMSPEYGGATPAGLEKLKARAAELRQQIDLEAELVREHERGTGLGTGDLRPTVAPPEPKEKGAKGGGGKGSDDRMSVWRDELHQRLQGEQHFFADSKAEELGFWQGKLAEIQGGGDQEVKLRRQVNDQIFQLQKALAQQEERVALERIGTDQKLTDERFARHKSAIAAEQALGKISAREAIRQEQALLDEKWSYDKAYYEKKIAAAHDDTATQQKLLDEQALAYEKYATQVAALTAKMAEANKKAWDDIVAPIERAVDSSVTGIVMGTTTVQKALANLAQSILSEFVNSAVKGVFAQLGNLVGGSLVGEGGGGSGGGMLSGIVGKILGGVVGTAVGGPVGGIFGSEAGSALLNALPAFEKGGIASAAGGWQVPGDTLGYLHKNEMVLPADLSQFVQGAAAQYGGGGGQPVTVNFSVAAMDSQDVGRFFRSNGAALVAGINHAMRNGSPLRTS
jgi:hypothetical protein